MTRGPRNPDWPAEMVEELKRRWEAGETASQIAKALGVTRNAVIGKQHRLGLKRSPAAGDSTRAVYSRLRSVTKVAARAKRPKPEKPPRAPMNNLTAINMRRKAGARARDLAKAEPVVMPPPPATARPWITRRFGECAFPVDGEGADTRSCCGPVQPGSPYCAEHHAVAFRKPVRTGRSYERSMRRLAA